MVSVWNPGDEVIIPPPAADTLLIPIPLTQTAPQTIAKQVHNDTLRQLVARVLENPDNDVAEVMIIESHSQHNPDTIAQTILIEDQSANKYVLKSPKFSGITVQRFKPRKHSLSANFTYGAGYFWAFDPRYRRNSAQFSPALYLYFARIGRWRLPAIELDLTGIGITAQYRLWDVVYAGPILHWNWDKTLLWGIGLSIDFKALRRI